MSLSDCIAPYEFANITTDPLGEIEPTAKFHAEFPNGHVPIRFVPALAPEWEGEFESWVSELLARHQAALSMVVDVDECEYLRSQYLNAFGWTRSAHSESNTSRRNPLINERKCHISALMGQGLTLRQIARYIPADPIEVVETLRVGRQVDAATAEQYLLLDEAIAAGGDRKFVLAKQFGLHEDVVAHLARLRGVKVLGPRAYLWDTPDYDEITDRIVALRYIEGYHLDEIAPIVLSEYPHAQHVTYHHVVWQTRLRRTSVTARIDRLRTALAAA